MCGTVLDSRTINRTRKPHQCGLCGRLIPKGTMCSYIVSVDHGDMSAGHDCLDCMEFIQTPEARSDYMEDDGCVYGFAFQDRPYARFPILEPVSDLQRPSKRGLK